MILFTIFDIGRYSYRVYIMITTINLLVITVFVVYTGTRHFRFTHLQKDMRNIWCVVAIKTMIYKIKDKRYLTSRLRLKRLRARVIGFIRTHDSVR